MGLGWWTRADNRKKLDGGSSAAVLRDDYAASEELEPEPKNHDRNQGKDRRYQPGDHPKSVWAAAERDPADVHTPNARDQRCRQEYHREHCKDVKISVGFLLDL